MSDIQLHNFGFVVMRSTLLPLYSPGANGTDLFIGRDDSPKDLLSKMDTPLFREALLLSSRSLYKEFQSLKEQPTLNKKVFRKLFQYFLRFHSRPTPYGISAGSTFLDIGEKTSLHMAAAADNGKTVRLNFSFYQAFIASFLSAPEIYPELSFFSNNTFGDNFRGHSFLRCSRYPYNRSQLGHSRLIREIVRFCRTTRTYPEIIRFIGQSTGDEASAPILAAKMIDIELLLPDIYPDILSADVDRSFMKKLPDGPPKMMMKELLEKTRDYVNARIGEGTVEWNTADAFIRQRLNMPGLDAFYVNYELKPGQSTLGTKIIESLTRFLIAILPLQLCRTDRRLEKFVALFRQRYGDGVEVPLCTVLDERLGIGFPVAGETIAEPPGITEWDAFLLRLFDNSLFDPATKEITLTAQQIRDHNKVYKNPAEYPTLFTTFTILPGPSGDVDKGDFMVLFKGAEMGSPATKKIARVPGREERADEYLKSCVSAEKEFYCRRDIHPAEIKYLPRAGNGANILLRKNHLASEIPLQTAPSGAKNNIDPANLKLVWKHNTLQLIEAESSRRILPRATTVYDHTTSWSMSYNSFLSALSEQDVAYIGWDWGVFNRLLSHFPRLTIGDCILSEEAWIIRRSTFPAASLKQFDTWDPAFLVLANELAIPRFVNFIENDTSLFLDLGNRSCKELLFEFLLKSDSIHLSKAISSNHQLPARGKEGSYCSEFVIPLRIDNRQPGPIEGNSSDQLYTQLSLCSSPYLADEILLNIAAGIPGLLAFTRVQAAGACQLRCIWASSLSPCSIEPAVKDLLGIYEPDRLIWRLEISQSRQAVTPIEIVEASFILEIHSLLHIRKSIDQPAPHFVLALFHIYNYMKQLTADKQECIQLADLLITIHQQGHPGLLMNEKLADSYRNLLKCMQQDYATLIQSVKGPFNRLLQETGKIFTPIMNADQTMKVQKIKELIHRLGSTLMAAPLTTHDLSILFDFIRKYLQQEEQLLRFRNISMQMR